jgi:hypothetical protein
MPIAMDRRWVALELNRPLAILREALDTAWDLKQEKSLRALRAADVVANFAPHTSLRILL